MRIHKASEDYPEAMLMMQEKHGYIRSIDVAEQLGVTKPSVSYSTKRLREAGYITMDSDSYITLTDTGMEIARMTDSSENELLSKLTALTKRKDEWMQSVGFAVDLLSNPSVKVKAKALWLLGEMGLLHPPELAAHMPLIAAFLASDSALLRERALNALGRIGRGDHSPVEPYLTQMRLLAADLEPAVRLAFIWACENIAVNTPTLFEEDLPLFASLLFDKNERVRIEAPEIFRVLGSRIPNAVLPYRAKLLLLSEKDDNRVVRIHAGGAVRAIDKST